MNTELIEFIDMLIVSSEKGIESAKEEKRDMGSIRNHGRDYVQRNNGKISVFIRLIGELKEYKEENQ